MNYVRVDVPGVNSFTLPVVCLYLFLYRRVKGAPSGGNMVIGVGSMVIWLSGFGYCEDLEEKTDN